MDIIKKFFDDFTFHARVMPVLVSMIPVILFGLFCDIIYRDMLTHALYVVVVIAFIAFSSRISREMGKKYEEKIYAELKEKPTTIILRYSDKRIDSVAKTRFHRKLNEKIEGLKLPLKLEDENEKTDEQYQSAANWLRIYANSNREKEPRVYQELKEYNFWRNLYGLKNMAILVYALIAIREFFIMEKFDWKVVFVKPYPEYMAFIIMIISVLSFIFFVNGAAVQRKAFDYAKALAEVSEKI